MIWHYTVDNEKQGPIDFSELANLISTGVVKDSTLLWKEGMSDWKALKELKRSAQVFDDSEMAFCAESGMLLAKDQLVRIGDCFVSAAHKDAYVQKLQEGSTEQTGVLEYAGFWIRFLAKFIDGLILGVVNMVLSMILSLFSMGFMTNGGYGSSEPEVNPMFIVAILAYYVFIFGVQIGYSWFFLPRYGATPGKMAVGLKVVEPNGAHISGAKAIGRYFSEWISSMILFIGYIMAAGDEEKRALHDRICSTRVIKK